MENKKELEKEFDKLFAELKKKSKNNYRQQVISDINQSLKEGELYYENEIQNIKECNELCDFVEKELIPNLIIGNECEFVTNRFSGHGCLLTPLQVALYDYIIGADHIINSPRFVFNDSTELLLKKFNLSRYYFRNNWLKEYLILID